MNYKVKHAFDGLNLCSIQNRSNPCQRQKKQNHLHTSSAKTLYLLYRISEGMEQLYYTVVYLSNIEDESSAIKKQKHCWHRVSGVKSSTINLIGTVPIKSANKQNWRKLFAHQMSDKTLYCVITVFVPQNKHSFFQNWKFPLVLTIELSWFECQEKEFHGSS